MEWRCRWSGDAGEWSEVFISLEALGGTYACRVGNRPLRDEGGVCALAFGIKNLLDGGWSRTCDDDCVRV